MNEVLNVMFINYLEFLEFMMENKAEEFEESINT